MAKRESLAASAERMASLLSITWFTTVRLTRTVSSWLLRCLTALGISGLVGVSRMMMNPRSACGNTRNRLSRILCSTSSSPSELARLLEISIRALSLASGLTETRSEAFEAASILVMMVDEGVSAFSSSISSAHELPEDVPGPRPAGAGLRSDGVEAKHGVADSQLVVLRELSPAFDPLSVQQAAIAATEVFDKKLVSLTQDLDVLPADGAHLQHDVAAW